jgi:hypothetical protein
VRGLWAVGGGLCEHVGCRLLVCCAFCVGVGLRGVLRQAAGGNFALRQATLPYLLPWHPLFDFVAD